MIYLGVLALLCRNKCSGGVYSALIAALKPECPEACDNVSLILLFRAFSHQLTPNKQQQQLQNIIVFSSPLIGFLWCLWRGELLRNNNNKTQTHGQGFPRSLHGPRSVMSVMMSEVVCNIGPFYHPASGESQVSGLEKGLFRGLCG